jgi:hypothetical protein
MPRGTQGRFELGPIRDNGARVEADVGAVRNKNTAGRGAAGRLQLAAQRRKRRAETGAAGFGLPFRPEQLDQLLARVHPVRVARQKGEERRRPVRPEARDDQIALPRLQPAQHFDPPRGFQHLLDGGRRRGWHFSRAYGGRSAAIYGRRG